MKVPAKRDLSRAAESGPIGRLQFRVKKLDRGQRMRKLDKRRVQRMRSWAGEFRR